MVVIWWPARNFLTASPHFLLINDLSFPSFPIRPYAMSAWWCSHSMAISHGEENEILVHEKQKSETFFTRREKWPGFVIFYLVRDFFPLALSLSLFLRITANLSSYLVIRHWSWVHIQQPWMGNCTGPVAEFKSSSIHIPLVVRQVKWRVMRMHAA